MCVCDIKLIISARIVWYSLQKGNMEGRKKASREASKEGRRLLALPILTNRTKITQCTQISAPPAHSETGIQYFIHNIERSMVFQRVFSDSDPVSSI